MEVQLCHILRDKDVVDEYRIWVNTTDRNDIEYFKELRNSHPGWITLDEKFMKEAEVGGSKNIHRFFTSCRDPGTVYVRLDDDIVYIHPGSIKRLVESRLRQTQPLLVYGNIVNNAAITHLHQRTMAMVAPSKRYTGYACMDETGWKNPQFAQEVHNNFFRRFADGSLEAYMMNDWLLWGYERVSINCISWLGEEFEKLNVVVGIDEEQWLSVEAPKKFGRPNVIAGNTLFCHYAFYTQRPTLDSDPSILKRYAEIAGAFEAVSKVRATDILTASKYIANG